ncbi:hypothetical protein [Ruminococcus albus]|uniref:Uncharacterized protein n=1 Tax=Ruminococcus albus TaxID=1264 RepID=A0A1H7GIH2_RUMAL|nr:hypothetical protein [Ruminococcus albus]SEK37854.1 hypothetical protein SAMN05216469_102121 [Ruminococcus albus]
MKEKYRYESLKDLEPMDALLFVSLALFIIALIKREALETKVFFTLLAISLVLFSCWIIYLNLQGSFTADDKAVTFGKIIKKRIDYSTIKSIDMSRSTITRRQKRKRYAKLVEWITFHCEDGDHKFAGVLVPEQECRSPGSEMSMYHNDWSVSPFSRLKIYIEDKIMKDSRSIPDTDPKKEQKKMKGKYEYDSTKKVSTLNDILMISGIIILIFALLKYGDLEDQDFWLLISIAGSALIFWGARTLVPMQFTADENAVTFYRFFRKKIAYSSIKSIDLRREKKPYNADEVRAFDIKTYYIEILTFHCENGDHSFACKSEPSQKTITMSNNSEIVSPDDTTYSPFSRLKIYIEDIKKKS